MHLRHIMIELKIQAKGKTQLEQTWNKFQSNFKNLKEQH